MTFTDLVDDARRLVQADSVSYTIGDLTASINRAFERVVSLIRQAEGRWQWDDSNNTDFPRATADITADQQDYELDPTHYGIERVEVKDEDGAWHKLSPIDQADIYNQSMIDLLKTAGAPMYYDKVGNSILLYPKPSYTQTASLCVFHQRGPSYFTTSDTTKSPGFNPLYHRLLSLWSGYDYAFINQLTSKDNLYNAILVMEEELKESYARRDKDEHIRLRPRVGNYR
jgi:hypothetical protein